jgi:Virulence factor
MSAMLTVIWWRDIPAQVVAKDGRRASKIVLHPRFQVAIDKAAVKSGRRAMDEYIAEWHKTQRPCSDDLETEANTEAARLEAAYSKVELAALVANGGAAADKAGSADGAATDTPVEAEA